MKVIKWFARFLEDENGKGSRTGIVTYLAVYALHRMIEANIADPKFIPDQTIMLVIGCAILFGISAINKKVISDVFSGKVKNPTKE